MNDFQKQVRREFRLAVTAIHAMGQHGKFEDWSEERKSKLYRDVAIFEEAIDLVTRGEKAHVQPGSIFDVDAMLDGIAKDLIHAPEKISFFNP